MSTEVKKSPFTQSVMGHKTIVMVPVDLPNLCIWAGGEDVVYKAAIKNILYHGFSPNLRAAYAEKLEEVTGIPRRGVLNPDGTPKVRKVKGTDEAGNEVESEEAVLETEQEYENYLLAEGKITPAQGDALIQQLADSTDPKPRPSSGRKPTNAALESAAKYLNAVERQVRTPEQFIEIFEAANGMAFSSIGDGTFTLENVAKAIQINEDRKKAEVGSDFM